MAFNAPTSVVPTSDDRELLLGYLQLQRELVVSAAVGLDEERPLDPARTPHCRSSA